jgi:hypothetical protein
MAAQRRRQGPQQFFTSLLGSKPFVPFCPALRKPDRVTLRGVVYPEIVPARADDCFTRIHSRAGREIDAVFALSLHRPPYAEVQRAAQPFNRMTAPRPMESASRQA